LHQKLDNIPEKAGERQKKHLFFKDKPSKTFTIHFCDPIAAIQSLWKDPHISMGMVYAPAKIFSGEKSGRNCMFSEMWTGKWWHILQSMLPLGATVAPVIIAIDKTQFTQFSENKSAYLFCVQCIFHDSICIVLQPLIDAGQKSVEMVSADGAVCKVHPILTCYVSNYPEQCLPLIDAGQKSVEMVSADGAVCKVHPILTCYVSNYPEQCLVTCIKCKAPAIELGNKEPHEQRTQEWTKSILQESNQCIPTKAVVTITALLDFIYLAQYTTHSTETLGYLQNFNIPKFHSFLHYVETIETFGTTDNYNTEIFEQHHIDFSEHGWRATNQRTKFPQMIFWLSHRKKIVGFDIYQKSLQSSKSPPASQFTQAKTKQLFDNHGDIKMASPTSSAIMPFKQLQKPPIPIPKEPNFPN
ncbi:hypothetical protein CVT25_000227, partial [Psilocybe cyanescens]